MSEDDYYGNGQPGGDPQGYMPGGMYSSPSGGAPMYGDGQSSLTDMRTSYGNGAYPGMLAYGAASGVSIVGQGAYMGAGRMMADLGGMIRPISYTPPARVYSGYGGRVQQSTTFMGSVASMTGIRDAPRGTSPYLYGLNSAHDAGERAGLAGAGLAMSAATIAAADIGGRLGGAAFGFAGGIAGGLAGYAIAGYATDKIYEGVAARRQTQDFLERTSNQYIGSGSADADPRLGSGFSRHARQNIGEHIRKMDTGDRMLNGDDLQGVLQGATSLGMFAGTSGVEDFKKKFKSIVENVKVVTTTLNQTLQEGLQTMKELKGVGIQESGAGAAVLQAQTYGKMAGRSATEMLGMGLQGAELFRGTGVTMNIGFQASMMNLASVRASRDAGLISQEAVAQAGGEEALAQRMTGSTLAYTQSAVGRGFGAMYAGAGGTFNQQAFMGALNGNMDAGQAALKAARSIGDPRSMIEYEVNQEKIRSEQGKMFGGRGLDVGMLNETLMQAKSISRWTHADMDTSTLYTLKQRGVSDMEARAHLAAIKNPEVFYNSQQKASQAVMEQTLADQAMRNTLFYRVGEQISDVAKNVVDPASSRVISGYNYVAEGTAKLFDSRYVGRTSYNKAGTGYEAFDSDAVTPEQRAAATGGNSNIDKTTLGARTAGRALTGELLAVRGDRSSSFSDAGLSVSDYGIKREGENEITLDSSGMVGLGQTAGMSRASLAKILKQSESVVSRDQAVAMEADGSLVEHLKKAKSGIAGIRDITKVNSMTELGKAVFGEGEMTRAQYASLVLATKGMTRFEKAAESDLGVATAAQSVKQDIYAVGQSGSTGIIDKAMEVIDPNNILKDSKTKGLYAKALLAKTPADREAALKAATESAVNSGRVDVSSPEWLKLAAQAGSASPDQRAAATTADFEYGVMRVREQSLGTDILAKGLEIGLASITSMSEDEKKMLISTSKEVGSGSAAALAVVANKDRYDKVQKLLADSGSHGKVLSDTLSQVKGYQVLEGIGTNASTDDRRKALEEANIPSGMREQVLENFKNKGANAGVEESISVARKAAGDNGSSTGSTSKDNSAQDTYALQTNMNLATLAAFQALTSKLGGIK